MKEKNPFKEIESTDEAPKKLKKEVLDSIGTLGVMTRISEHFTATIGKGFVSALDILLKNKKDTP